MSGPLQATIFVLSLFAGFGIWHLTGHFLGWWVKRPPGTIAFDPWLRRVWRRLDRILELDVEMALEEAALMDDIGHLPPETQYQAIKRLDLGRRVERAILEKLAQHGIGEALPPDPEPEKTITLEPIPSPSRRPPPRTISGD